MTSGVRPPFVKVRIIELGVSPITLTKLALEPPELYYRLYDRISDPPVGCPTTSGIVTVIDVSACDTRTGASNT